MNAQMIVDTDVVIDFLRGNAAAVSFFNSHSKLIGFSVITIAEIYSGIRTNKEETEVARFFLAFPIFDVSKEIAQFAGKFMQRFHRSHGIEMPDALIAATCAIHQYSLQTLNDKHYPMFNELKPAYLKKAKSESI